MHPTRTPYNHISRKASTNFKYSISNIKIIFGKESQRRNVAGEKNVSFDFQTSHTTFIRV